MAAQDLKFRVVPFGAGKPRKNGKFKPGYKIEAFVEEKKGGRVTGKKVVAHYYNDGHNRPTQEGKMPFTRRAAIRAMSPLKREEVQLRRERENQEERAKQDGSIVVN